MSIMIDDIRHCLIIGFINICVVSRNHHQAQVHSSNCTSGSVTIPALWKEKISSAHLLLNSRNSKVVARTFGFRLGTRNDPAGSSRSVSRSLRSLETDLEDPFGSFLVPRLKSKSPCHYLRIS